MSDLRTLLFDIYQKHGELSPEVLVAEAAPEGSQLHSRFLWDDAAAGHQYRLTQARELIRSVKVTFIQADQEVQINQWHSIRREGMYQPIEEIVQDDIAREILLRTAEREWKSLRRRWSYLTEFVAMVQRDVA